MNTHLCISGDVSQDNYGCPTMNSVTHDGDEIFRLVEKRHINKNSSIKTAKLSKTQNDT